MADTGSGIGTPVAPAAPGPPSTAITIYPVRAEGGLVNQESALRLSRYAQVIGGYGEDALWGINRSGLLDTNECFQPWMKDQRDYVAFYLAEAQWELEKEIGYPLAPKWVVGRVADQESGHHEFVDEQDWKIPLFAKWGMVLEPGVKATASVDAASVVSHATDPAVIGPIGTTVTDPYEIKVYYPDKDIEITPSKIQINAGFVTIEIPRCRLVKEAFANNEANGIDYTDLNNFLATVDVVRVYNNPSTNAVLVAPHTCTTGCSLTGCGEYTQTACIYVTDVKSGKLSIVPATYSGGTWVRSSARCNVIRVRLNYRAGLKTLTRQAEDAIRMLAHAKMPNPPCGCDILHKMWDADSNIPSILTAERINCPWGLTDGAWRAYKYAQRMKIYRAGIL